MHLDDERQSAQHNFERLAASIPPRLSEREDRFASQIELSKISSSKKLESLYSFMNELYGFALKYTPCKKGCSYCCHYSITVCEIEIAHIEKHAKIKRKKEFLNKKNFHGYPCPFLEQGICSIYDARPFVCRKHVVLTSTNLWCNTELCNDEEFPILQFTNIDKAFHHIRRESESFNIYDIRQVFCRSMSSK